MTNKISDADALTLLRGALAAQDNERILWTEKNVEYARLLSIRGCGSVASLNEVIAVVGEDRAAQLIPLIIEKRKFDNILKGYGSPCHYCGGSSDLIYFNFALMSVDSSNIRFGETVVSAAISVATLPLLGAGLLRLPGRVMSGEALHLKLVVCKSCCKEHGNMFGLFMLNEQRASQHPLWRDLHSHGFTKYLPENQMPDEFKHSYGQDL